jgi:hypothetical protein
MILHCVFHATNKSADFTVVSIIWLWNMVGYFSFGRERIPRPYGPREIEVSERVEGSIYYNVSDVSLSGLETTRRM